MRFESRSGKVLTPEQQVQVACAERSPSSATATFDDRYAERSSARKVRSQSKAKARDQQVGTKPTEEPLDPDKPENDKAVRELARARAQSRKKVERRVLQDGWQWHGGFYGGETPRDGYTQPPFTAAGFASERHPLLRRFVAYTPKARKKNGNGIKTGRLKSAVEEGDSKMLALYEPTICWNQAMRGIIRVDIDAVFQSDTALVQAILAYDTPLPNLVVGQLDCEKRVVNPHFYWLLDQAVCWTERGRRKPKTLLGCVARGLCAKLLPIGADPGGLSNPSRGKNPLWHTAILEPEPYRLTSGSSPKANRDLLALADYVPLNITTNTLERCAAEEILPEVQLRDAKRIKSNRFFTDLQRHAFSIRSAHAVQEDFAKELRGYASRIVELDDRSESVVRRVTDYAWRSFDPAKPRKRPRPGQGALRDECRGKPRGETEAMGGRYAAAMRHSSTFNKLLQASKRLIDRGTCSEGEVPSARLLAAESGTSERQCRRYYDELRAALLAIPESPIFEI